MCTPAVPSPYLKFTRERENGLIFPDSRLNAPAFLLAGRSRRYGGDQADETAEVSFFNFYKSYNMEFEDKRTVYSKFAFWLLPWEVKPGVP